MSGVCMTNEMGVGYDYRIYWIFMQLVTTVDKSLSDTLSSSSSGHSHFTTPLYSVVLLNSDLNYDWLNSGLQLAAFPSEFPCLQI
jgi:hypothetical protein